MIAPMTKIPINSGSKREDINFENGMYLPLLLSMSNLVSRDLVLRSIQRNYVMQKVCTGELIATKLPQYSRKGATIWTKLFHKPHV